MSFFIGRGFAELQIQKKWKWPYLLNWVEHCDEILHTHWYWQDVAHEIVKWHLGLVEVLPNFKFWKKWNLTLKPFGIFWYNFADILVLKRSSPRNCKMTFIIGRGFAECQIMKKWKWRVPRLIWVFAGRTCHFVGLSWGGSYGVKHWTYLNEDSVAKWKRSGARTFQSQTLLHTEYKCSNTRSGTIGRYLL